MIARIIKAEVCVNPNPNIFINDSRELHVKRKSKGLQKGFKPKTSENVSGKTESN